MVYMTRRNNYQDPFKKFLKKCVVNFHKITIRNNYCNLYIITKDGKLMRLRNLSRQFFLLAIKTLQADNFEKQAKIDVLQVNFIFSKLAGYELI